MWETQCKARAARRFSADEIADCAEQLMASFRKATTAALVKWLKADGRSLPTARAPAIFQWMGKKGTAARQFPESQQTFAKCVASVNAADVDLTFRQQQPFHRAAQLIGFLYQLQPLA